MTTSAVIDAPLTPEATTDGLLLNRYRPICRLGRGGQADVFLAMTPGPADFHRLVVIKVLRDAAGNGLTDVESFLDEARLAARLNHPNVIQTFEVGDYRGKPCIVMEHLEGQSLDRVRHAARSSKDPKLDAIWVRVVADALGGLAYAHELADYERRPLNIVHRDISPQNIFVTYHGQVKVLDFGIARVEGSASNTGVGFVKGKANYVAPEQVKGDNVDARADLFSIGVVLWELLTGVRLVKGDGAQAIFYLMNETLPRLRDKRPDIDPQLDDIVTRALEKDPGRRYPSAAAMKNALEGYLESLSAAARTDDVAQLLQNLFDAQRDAVRRKIQQFMSKDAAEDLEAHSQLLTLDGLKVPVLSTALQVGSGQTAVGTTGATSPLFLAVVGAVVIGLGGAAFWASSGGLSQAGQASETGAAAALAPAAPTAVAIDSEPSGASVFAGDRELGTTPLTMPIPEDATDIRVSAAGFVDAVTTVSAGDGDGQLVVLAPVAGSAEPTAKKAPTRRSTRRARRPSTRRAPRGASADKTPAKEEPAAAPAAPTTKAPPSVKVIDEAEPDVRIID